MNVLSLFDGISCGQVALQRAGVKVGQYFTSEINPAAIAVTQSNFPGSVQLGDVRNVRRMVEADLLIGGSPCQGFSRTGRNLGFNDPRSLLFFDFAAIKNRLNPKWFLLENTPMKPKDCFVISAFLGVEPVSINSGLFSAQNRERLYWTNIPIAEIIDQGRTLDDVLERDGEHLKAFKLNKTKSRLHMWSDGQGNGGNNTCPNLSKRQKSNTLTTKQDRGPNAGLIEFEDFCRYLTPLECERLQTLPDNYTEAGGSRDKRYEMLGNGWTVDVIAHILKGIK